MMCSSIDTPIFTQRVEALQWEKILQTLYIQGFAKTGQILSSEECHQIINLYGVSTQFRSCVKMQQYRFGQGEYQYFAYPLPAIVQSLRETVYPYLKQQEGSHLPDREVLRRQSLQVGTAAQRAAS